jgi:predicted RNA binding protein with dsRBD fold (UPF0201 family)
LASIYQRKKKRGKAVWWCKYYIDGQPHYLNLRTCNITDAKRRKLEIEVQLEEVQRPLVKWIAPQRRSGQPAAAHD